MTRRFGGLARRTTEFHKGVVLNSTDKRSGLIERILIIFSYLILFYPVSGKSSLVYLSSFGGKNRKKMSERLML
jgi:hypothetical protein